MAFTYEKETHYLGQAMDNVISVIDPIHGKIVVPPPFSNIILTKEMQRLSEITQTGLAHLNYPGLKDGNRLEHCIGAYHIITKFLDRIEELIEKSNGETINLYNNSVVKLLPISADDKMDVLIAKVIHDCGHGPLSHALEKITKYAHEKRITDIILEETELGIYICSLVGIARAKKIIGYIIDLDSGQNIYDRLLKSLVSSQMDGDRLDFLLRDCHYAGKSKPFNLETIISSMKIIINANGQYELVYDIKALDDIENVLLRRFQNYRSIYLAPYIRLSENYVKEILCRYQNSKALQEIDVPHSFKVLAQNPTLSNIHDFLNLSESEIRKGLEVLSKNIGDPIISYISDMESHKKDYMLLSENITKDHIQRRLKEIFGNQISEDLLAVMAIDAPITLYKHPDSDPTGKTIGIKIQDGNKICDITEVSDLIKKDIKVDIKKLYFNQELLRLELGMSKEEFNKYEDKLTAMMEELNKKPEEFELKYILDETNDKNAVQDVLQELLKAGFKVVNNYIANNNDNYYDTNNLDLYNAHSSLRIREEESKLKGTFKTPLPIEGLCSSRAEIPGKLEVNEFNHFITVMNAEMKKQNVEADLSNIHSQPLLNSLTNRTNFILEKDGVQVCLSHDLTAYTNYNLGGVEEYDEMIEIEAIGALANRNILIEIDSILKGVNNLSLTQENKYERGMNKTIAKVASAEYDNDKEKVFALIKSSMPKAA